MTLENVSDEDLVAELARRREAKEIERQRKRQAKKDKIGALVDELKLGGITGPWILRRPGESQEAFDEFCKNARDTHI